MAAAKGWEGAETGGKAGLEGAMVTEAVWLLVQQNAPAAPAGQPGS